MILPATSVPASPIQSGAAAPSLPRPDPATPGLLLGAAAFLLEHLALGRCRTAARFDPGDRALAITRQFFAPPDLFQTMTQPFAGDRSIAFTRSLVLTLHLDTGRPMLQINTRRRLVDLLTSGTATTDKTFVEILLANSQIRQTALQ